MDNKIYTKEDMANTIKKIEELTNVNAKLEQLLYRGSNDEKLVNKRIELQNSIRSLDLIEFYEPIKIDEEFAILNKEFKAIVNKFKSRKIKLELEINKYKNGN